jgi:(S)-sulfolactate dehydrogenase
MAPEQRIIVTEPLTQEAIEWLSERALVEQIAVDEAGFDEAIVRATALIVRTYTTVDQDLLDRAPALRVIGRAGTGLDNIDLDACRERNIEVVNTPDANRQAVVEYVVSILANICRPLPTVVPAGLSGPEWSAARRDAMASRQMNESTLGILGLGRIGKRVAEVAVAIGFKVQFHDVVDIPVVERCDGIESVSMEKLLCTSDILTVHVDGRAENRHLFGQSEFDQLQEGMTLVNTSRGFVLDESALASVLTFRQSMHAVLDVHEDEPVPSGSPLAGLANVALLPHAASRTAAAQRAMSWVVRDVWQTLVG